MTSQSDYVCTNDLADTMVPLDELPELFRVPRRTITRWIAADNITTHPYPPSEHNRRPGRAVRLGDIMNAAKHSTRWRLQQ